MQQREVEREPTVPDLPNEAVRLLTELCFRQDNQPQKLDGLFVFGTSWGMDVLADYLANLVPQCSPDVLYITGGPSPADDFEGDRETPEAERLYMALQKRGVNMKNVVLETTSHSCFHNVAHTLELYPCIQTLDTLGFVGKTQSAGREFLILKKFLPEVAILQYTWVAQHYEKPITVETWRTLAQGRQRVWGEFLRIKKYGERGNLAYPKEIQMLVNRIERLVTN